MSDQRREHERVEAVHPVEAKCETWSQFLTLHTQNIAPSGAGGRSR